ncbi:hypothetical protein ACFXJ8_11850 [Nonomuraea sp. NPDC059194]|uniref:hypothetical protein n=1 Tax=Nonomuraea sp. NPDC059194 TaxID=3346764 RepID=UPI0036B28905
MASGLYASTFLDVWALSLTTLDFEDETHQWALYNASRVPDYNANTAYSATNEIVGTGYTAKGKVVTGTTLAKLAAVVTYDSDAVSWPSSTLTNVRHVDMFAETVTAPIADPLMIGMDLGLNYSTNDGTLAITPHANGLFTADFTP